MKHTTQERPQALPEATPAATPEPTGQTHTEAETMGQVIPLFDHQKAQPVGLVEALKKGLEAEPAKPTAARQPDIVQALKKGLAEQDRPMEEPTKARPVSRPRKAKPDPRQPGLFDRVLSFFTSPDPEPERQTEQEREGPKPWQATQPPEPPEATPKPPARPQTHKPTPEPKSGHTDAERAALIEKAARAMLPPDGQAPRHRPEHLRRPPPPPVLKPKRERTRSPPQR